METPTTGESTMSPDPRLDELFLRWQDRLDAGETPRITELCADCPELREEFERHLQAMAELAEFMEMEGAAVAEGDDEGGLRETASGGLPGTDEAGSPPSYEF